MSLVLNSTSGGSVTINEPTTASNFTQTLAAATGTLAPLVSGTAVAASGTAVDFTVIPAYAKRITVMFQGVSTSGASIVLIQLGTSGSITATGYLGAAADVAGGTVANYTTGFGTSQAAAATTVRHGSISIQNITSNSWVASGVIAASNGAQVYPIAGSVSLSAALDRVRITTVNGTDTFDAGTINIMWE